LAIELGALGGLLCWERTGPAVQSRQATNNAPKRVGVLFENRMKLLLKSINVAGRALQ
jgi:hypothetical protein